MVTRAVVTLTVNSGTLDPVAIRTRLRAGDGVVGVGDALGTYTADVFTDVTGPGPLTISLNALLPELNLIADNAGFLTVYTAIAYGNTGEAVRFNSLESLTAVPQLTLTYDLAVVPEPAALGLVALAGVALLRRRVAARG